MNQTVFRMLVGVAGVYHAVLAILGLVLPDDSIAKVIQAGFGVVLEQGPQGGIVIRFAAAYMLAFGVMLLFLASNPVTHRILAFPALVLFGVRAINRVLVFNGLMAAGMTTTRNLVGVAILCAYALILLVFLVKNRSDA